MARSAPAKSGRAVAVDPGERWIRVAVLGRPHGVRGELRLWLDNPTSDLFAHDPPLRLLLGEAPPRPLRLHNLRPAADAWIAAIEGVADRDAAARLTGGVIEVPRSALPPPEDGAFYHTDVIGAEVIDADTGALLGHVRAVTTTSVDVLVVGTVEGGEVLVPIVDPYVVSIAEEPGRVIVRDLDAWR